MTKVYSVKPGSQEIRVSDGRTIAGGEIKWGKLCGLEGAALARMILADATGDQGLATRIAQRFKWRTIESWTKDQPHAITEDEIAETVKDILAVEKENAPMIAKMQRERPNIVTDRPAPGQAYTSNPELQPNKPKEADNGN